MSFDMLQDRSTAVQQTYQTTGVPESFLVNREGIIEERLRELLYKQRMAYAIYSELNLGNPDLSDEDLLAAIETNPILLNRPIVVTEKGTRLARPLEVVQEIL